MSLYQYNRIGKVTKAGQFRLAFLLAQKPKISSIGTNYG